MIIEKLQEEWNQIRKSPSLLMILLVILGIVLALHPGKSIGIVVRAVGLVLLIEGGYRLYKGYQVNRGLPGPLFRFLDVLMALAGVVVLLRPSFLINLFPTVVGVILIIRGLFGIFTARMVRGKDEFFSLPMLFDALPLILGLIMFFFPAGSLTIVVRLVGIYLVADAFMGKRLRETMDKFIYLGDFLNAEQEKRRREQEDFGPDVEDYYDSGDDVYADYKVIDDDDEE